MLHQPVGSIHHIIHWGAEGWFGFPSTTNKTGFTIWCLRMRPKKWRRVPVGVPLKTPKKGSPKKARPDGMDEKRSQARGVVDVSFLNIAQKSNSLK